MAINRSSLYDALDNEPETFVDVVIKSPGNGENQFRLYAVTAINETMSDHNHPYGPAIRLGCTNSKAAAGATAGRYRRWLKEYNDNV